MVSKGTVDALMEVGWVRIRGRRRTPGPAGDLWHDRGLPRPFRPREYRRSAGHGRAEGAGFLEAAPPSGFTVPQPSDALAADEDPYEGEEEETSFAARRDECRVNDA